MKFESHNASLGQKSFTQITAPELSLHRKRQEVRKVTGEINSYSWDEEIGKGGNQMPHALCYFPVVLKQEFRKIQLLRKSKDPEKTHQNSLLEQGIPIGHS